MARESENPFTLRELEARERGMEEIKQLVTKLLGNVAQKMKETTGEFPSTEAVVELVKKTIDEKAEDLGVRIGRAKGIHEKINN